jgi:hypothetical protein
MTITVLNRIGVLWMQMLKVCVCYLLCRSRRHFGIKLKIVIPCHSTFSVFFSYASRIILSFDLFLCLMRPYYTLISIMPNKVIQTISLNMSLPVRGLVMCGDHLWTMRDGILARTQLRMIFSMLPPSLKWIPPQISKCTHARKFSMRVHTAHTHARVVREY